MSQADWDKVIADAKKEGGVTIYSSQALDALNKLGKDFEAKYGIPVTVVRAIDSDIQAKVKAEADSNKPIADLVIQASRAWTEDESKAGAFAKIDVPGFHQEGYTTEMNVSPNSDYFVDTAAVLTFGWNTELWPDGLKDYPGPAQPGPQGQGRRHRADVRRRSSTSTCTSRTSTARTSSTSSPPRIRRSTRARCRWARP